jgi:putative nucleotidyltransferase with HDIG domain
MEEKDFFSRGHSARVAEYSRKAGLAIGLPEKDLEILRWAALLHDIGKVGIVDAILQKPGQLTPEEMAIVREHPIIGQRIVQDLDALHEAAAIIRGHHERYDGKGYPDSLRGRKIPLLARILALAETFDTITSHTPYRLGRPVEVAAIELRKEKGSQFDPDLVDPFLEAILL